MIPEHVLRPNDGSNGMTERVLAICGPTASGKSALALKLAEVFDGVVINADSMQLYRELRILTARPDAAVLARAPHRLYGVLPAATPASAALWRKMALEEVGEARKAGKLPILVGGTGLYLQALASGLAPIPTIPPEVRMEAADRLRRLGNAGLYGELQTRDPVMAARLKPGDRQRLLRAWEVLEATGRSLADWQAEGGRGATVKLLPILLAPPRAALYAACDGRFLDMLKAGALAEAAALAGFDPGLPLMKAVGVRELLRHLRGEATLEEATAQAQQATRRYAKRQLTWFRHRMAEGHWLHEQYSESLDNEIFSFIRHFRLTTVG